MSELVKKSASHLRCHQRGIVRTRNGHIANQCAFRKLPVRQPHSQRSRSEVLVLILSRKHIEINPSDRCAVLEHIIDLHCRMPHRNLHGAKSHSEEDGRNLENTFLDPAVREKLTYLPLIKTVALIPYLPHVVSEIPCIHRRRVRLIPAPGFEDRRRLRRRAVARRAVYLIEERPLFRFAANHSEMRLHVGERGEAAQRRNPLAQRNHFRQYIHVRWIAAIYEQEKHL